MRAVICIGVLLLAAVAQGVPLRSNSREAKPIAPALVESQAQAREAGAVLGGLSVALSVANIVASVSAPFIVKEQKSAFLKKYDKELETLAVEDAKTAVYIEYLNTFLGAAPESSGLLEAIAASLRTTESAATAALRTHSEAQTFVDKEGWERFKKVVISKVAPKGLEETGKLVLTAMTDPSAVGKTLLDSLTGAATAASPLQSVAAGLVLTTTQISSTVLDLWRGTEASVFGAQLEQRMIEIRRLYADRTRMFCSLLGEVFSFIKMAFRDNVHFVEGGTKLTQLLYQVQRCGVLYADAKGLPTSPDSVGVGPSDLLGASPASPDDEIVHVELLEYSDMVARFPNMGPLGAPAVPTHGAKLAFDQGKLDVSRPLSENLAATNLNPPASSSRDGKETYRGLSFLTRRACRAQLKAAAGPDVTKLKAMCERGPLVALAVASVSCAFTPSMVTDATQAKMLNVTNYDQMRAFVSGKSPSGRYTPVELVRHNSARIGPSEPILAAGGAINNEHAFPGKRCASRHQSDLNYGIPVPESSAWATLAGKYIPGLGLLTTPVERVYQWYSPRRTSDPSLPRSYLLAKYAEPYMSAMTTYIDDIRILRGTATPMPGYVKVPVSPKTNDPLGDERNERTLVEQALQAGFILEKFVDNFQNIVAPDANIDTAMRPFFAFKLRPIPITCPFDAAGAAPVPGAHRGPLSDPKTRFCVGTTDFTLPTPEVLLDQIAADLHWWNATSNKVTNLPEFATRIASHFSAPTTTKRHSIGVGPGSV